MELEKGDTVIITEDDENEFNGQTGKIIKTLSLGTVDYALLQVKSLISGRIRLFFPTQVLEPLYKQYKVYKGRR